MARTCPNCSAEMRMERIFGADLDVCPNCGGIWFDAGELRTLIASGPAVAESVEARIEGEINQGPVEPGSMRLCPDDQIRLDQYRYQYTSPIMLDTCPRCGGVFVDDGELAKVGQWYSQSKQPPNISEEAAIAASLSIGESMRGRQRALDVLALSQTMKRSVPGWFGFAPFAP